MLDEKRNLEIGAFAIPEDGTLYHVKFDSTLCMITPEKMRVTPEMREQLFKEAHGGRFGGHLGDVKVHSELQRH